MKHLAPTYWPKGKRRGYCWLPPSSEAKCVMKVGTRLNLLKRTSLEMNTEERLYCGSQETVKILI